MEFGAQFWLALGEIIYINILLSGDNAVVIALACRNLPPKQRQLGIFFGSAAAIVLRVVLTIFVASLMAIPFLQLIGAAALLWIAIKLVIPEEEENGEDKIKAGAGLFEAVKTIAIADVVMSLDNVIGIAAAAKGDVTLLVIGLVISMPLIIFGSQIVLAMLSRFPILILAGGAVLGWLVGEIGVSDTAIKEWVDAEAAWLHYAAPIGFALLVIVVARVVAARRERAKLAAASAAQSPQA
jgi:YjbE family integral membrane protein